MRHRELLKRVTIFADLDDAALVTLERIAVERQYPRESVIVSQEDRGDALFVVCSGKVKVVLYGRSGREVILSVFKPGDFFGEMSLLDNQPRSANVIALESSTLLVIERRSFADQLANHPNLALGVLAELSRRLRRADAIIGNLALLDVYGRVARYLRELAKTEGEPESGSVVIRQRPTQQEIASMIGTSRETVSRALSEFQRRGFLELSGRRIILRASFALGDDSAIEVS
ncbi:MAG: Crp/Fnr family transcriptional regulator [Deltaproteobacteria bacterium]|nr:Crp/Fnr family transcriptional regulator [Deltaproteobacteria bacterium]